MGRVLAGQPIPPLFLARSWDSLNRRGQGCDAAPEAPGTGNPRPSREGGYDPSQGHGGPDASQGQPAPPRPSRARAGAQPQPARRDPPLPARWRVTRKGPCCGLESGAGLASFRTRQGPKERGEANGFFGNQSPLHLRGGEGLRIWTAGGTHRSHGAGSRAHSPRAGRVRRREEAGRRWEGAGAPGKGARAPASGGQPAAQPRPGAGGRLLPRGGARTRGAGRTWPTRDAPEPAGRLRPGGDGFSSVKIRVARQPPAWFGEPQRCPGHGFFQRSSSRQNVVHVPQTPLP